MPFLEINFSISTNPAMGVGPFWGQGEPKESHKEGGRGSSGGVRPILGGKQHQSGCLYGTSGVPDRNNRRMTLLSLSL